MLKPTDYFDLSQTAHAALFEGCEFAWDALKKLQAYLAATLCPGLHNSCEGVAYIGRDVFIGEGTRVEDGAMIKGPAIIGRNCQIRHNAYIREFVICGDDCVIGNACELKSAILFNGAVVPHLNYVGDSILGFRAHLGAGVILSNYRSLPGNIRVEVNGCCFDTGLEKFGAVVGDRAEIGANAVLSPGSVIGRDCVIYPGVHWRGYLSANKIVKNKASLEVVSRQALAP